MSSQFPNSLCNGDKCTSKHLSFDLTVDFVAHKLRGHVDHHIEAQEDGVTEFIVDSFDSLKVLGASCGDQAIQVTRGTHHKVLGTPVIFTLPGPLQKGAKAIIRVRYETTPGSSALQWLDSVQTADKQAPYLFTQCQAIHARSMVPCQDTPSCKVTYDAVITVPAGMTALMSGLAVGGATKANDHTVLIYRFDQPNPIPTYLIALAVGVLERRDISERCAVWSEPSVVGDSRNEFQETEKFLCVAEHILNSYDWGRYDLLVLPPSFPYGGMENPCLTFVTPTLLAGDGSNASVVAHELAHSWTGNLVTNRTWEHFWLNEGFTVFMERKIVGKIYGKEMEHFEAINGWKDLQDSVDHFGVDHPFTKLVVDLKDQDPDDAFSSVPYEKGFNFLWYLQNLVGESTFEGFLANWIKKHKFGTVTTDDFRHEFDSVFPDVSKGVDWDTWLYKPGMPPIEPKFDRTLAIKSINLANMWLEGAEEAAVSDMSGWHKTQIEAFLNTLLSKDNKPLTHEQLDKLDTVYKFTGSSNVEIRFRWAMLGLRSAYMPAIREAVKLLSEQGRMKFTRPLYREFAKVDRKQAVETFESMKKAYHPICRKMVGQDLGVVENAE